MFFTHLPFRTRIALVVPLLATFCCLPTSVVAASDPYSVTYPAVGLWNGYLSHTNIIECDNLNTESIPITLQMRDAQGSELTVRNAEIPGNGSTHIILNDLTNITDQYGTFQINLSEGDSARGERLRCRVMLYRLRNTSTEVPLEYAVSLPVLGPIQGTHYGLYNSIDPSGGAQNVFNWLTLFNSGENNFAGSLELYDPDGSLLSTLPIEPIAPNGRIDLPLGHDQAARNGQAIGMYRIVPNDAQQPYSAFLVRYAPRDESFAFAFSLLPVESSCSSEYLFASQVGNAHNWLELANTTATPVALRVSVHSSAGAQLSSETQTLSGFEQKHLYINSRLGDTPVGSIQLTCEEIEGRGFLAQSMFYGRNTADTATIAWAYPSQARLPRSALTNSLAGSINTYLGAANWLRTVATHEGSSASRVRASSEDGQEAQEYFLFLSERATMDLALHEFLGSDAIGVTKLEQIDSAAGSVTETLRVYSRADGSIGYITPIQALPISREEQNITLSPFITGLSAPVYLTHANDSSGRLFVVERAGRIRVVENGSLLTTPFLDVSSMVGLSGEQGLHSVAFHPNYSENGFFYIHYNDTNGDTVVARYQKQNNSEVLADAASAHMIFTLDQPDHFHNGGQLAFGPDGMLYIALGDGGFAGDPLNNGQNKTNVFGTILRIDVDGGDPYAIPSDNPFVSDNTVPSEIYAYGFRNPWRFSFDRETGKLFVGDVGQNDVEEIDLVEKGKNYGWSVMEGSRCFKPSTNCDSTGLEMPIAEYTHSEGNSVIGGYVYRGERFPSLQGTYLFGDFSSGRIWSLREASPGEWTREERFRSESSLFTVSFGEDQSGELYVVDINGTVYSLVLSE